MPQLIIHNHPLSNEELTDERLKRTLALSPRERMKIAFGLMKLAQRFKKFVPKEVHPNALILKRTL
jgi:hypothetical protein